MNDIQKIKKQISFVNLNNCSMNISKLTNRTKSLEKIFFEEKCNSSLNENIEQNSILNLPYYYSNLNRSASEQILRSINRPGCFLIRKHEYNHSTLIPSPYVLSMINLSLKISHFLLYKINQYLFIKPYSQEFYSSLQHFVHVHQFNPGILPCHLLEYPTRLSSTNDISSLTSSQLSSSSSSIILNTNKLIRQEIIGRGHFGVVYKGLYNGETVVAMKTFSPSCILSGDECESNMLNEARTMMYLNHPYLVHFYGITRCENQLCLVSEYVSNGCLLFWLQQEKQHESSLTCCFRHRLQLFSFQICDAMTYLESKSIIHRDLAARNCLIDEQANLVKVSDFGMARFLPSSMIYEGRCDTPFPLRWSSPEVLLYREYSSKSDVWSYGILLGEIYSLGQIPFGNSVSNDTAAQLIKTGQMPTKPSLANEIFYRQIISPCWALKANDRPSFAALKETLQKLILISARACLFH